MKSESLRFTRQVGKLVEAGILLLSFAVMATVLPEFHEVPNTVVVLYYVVVPGYCISSVMRSTKTITEGFFFSVVWSIALLASVASFESITPNQAHIPISLIVPAVTVVFLVYGQFHRRAEP